MPLQRRTRTMPSNPNSPPPAHEAEEKTLDNDSANTADSVDTPSETAASLPSSDHEEFLIDEAVLETFPASDPISPASPSPRSERRGEAPAQAGRQGENGNRGP